jgi:hypothetical protein
MSYGDCLQANVAAKAFETFLAPMTVTAHAAEQEFSPPPVRSCC